MINFFFFWGKQTISNDVKILNRNQDEGTVCGNRTHDHVANACE